VNFIEPADWSFPVPISFGPGRLVELSRICREAGIKRPMIVTDRGSRDLPFIAKSHDLLHEAGLTAGLFSDISPNPRDEEIANGVDVFAAGAHDGIVAIGGGSAMDGAKSIGLIARSGLDLWAFDYDYPSPDVSADLFPPLICIPTTAGTGAETESTAMVTRVQKSMKFCVWHPAFSPVATILDPELTVGLPRNLTAWTGVDALTHALEAYSVSALHPLCDGAALEGLRLITRYLPIAVEEPDNIEARGAMLVGSCLAGIAFIKGLGMVHAISHVVGAEYDTHHGLTNAILLPSVLRENLPVLGEKIEHMCHAMGLHDSSPDALVTAVEALLDRLDIPSDLASLGLPIGCAAGIGAKAMHDSAAKTDPGNWTEARTTALIDRVMHCARPTQLTTTNHSTNRI